MSRRLEVELTSDRGDGTWTWRAAGAREPRGVVGATILPQGAKVGDVLRAEADIDLDGVTIVAIVAPPEKHRNEAQRIEIIGPPRRDDQMVTTSLAPRDRDRDRERGPRRDRSDRPPRDGERRPPRDGERRPPRDGDRRPPRDQREPRGDRPRDDRDPRKPREGGERRPARPPRVEEPPKPKPKRLRPARTHRVAVLDELPPEHRPIAEQVLQGDIPAVRQAIDT
jgi:hypothetical protein